MAFLCTSLCVHVRFGLLSFLSVVVLNKCHVNAEGVLRRGPQDVKKGPRPPSANKRVQIPPDDEELLEHQESDPFSSSWLRPSTVSEMAIRFCWFGLQHDTSR
jgi:hypothetical protein